MKKNIETVATACGLSDKASCTEISEAELKKALIEVDYSNIVKAAKEIWYDNGMINRFESESEKVELLLNWLQTLDSNLLEPIELELSKLSEEDLDTVCCGEETEQERLASKSVNEFLNRISDEEYEIKVGDMVEITSYQQTIELCGRESQKFIGDLMYVAGVEGDVLKGLDYNFVGKRDVKLNSKKEQSQ
ncbi:hypothetical protein [Acinetobacter higginsii]|uniref:hypothetical protein n=1 Tax=Acinetobacter higginsii TaxID=70347 RepID=UPI00300B945D